MLRVIDMLVVHCSATPGSMDIGRDEIDNWHRARGWSGIGYHFVIRRDGTLEMGRPLGKMGAHARSFNAHSIGICLVGGLDDEGRAENNFTPEQWVTLSVVIAGLQETFDLDDEDVWGHGDLPEVRKECPCFDVQAWLREYEV